MQICRSNREKAIPAEKQLDAAVAVNSARVMGALGRKVPSGHPLFTWRYPVGLYPQVPTGFPSIVIEAPPIFKDFSYLYRPYRRVFPPLYWARKTASASLTKFSTL